MIDTTKDNPGIILVTLGPLKNVALAVSRAPEIVENFGHCVVMGGSANTVGNITPAVEYNIWCDSEAALQDTGNVSMWAPHCARGEPHITICWELNVQHLKELLVRAVS